MENTRLLIAKDIFCTLANRLDISLRGEDGKPILTSYDKEVIEYSIKLADELLKQIRKPISHE